MVASAILNQYTFKFFARLFFSTKIYYMFIITLRKAIKCSKNVNIFKHFKCPTKPFILCSLRLPTPFLQAETFVTGEKYFSLEDMFFGGFQGSHNLITLNYKCFITLIFLQNLVNYISFFVTIQ